MSGGKVGQATLAVRRAASWDALICRTGGHFVRGLQGWAEFDFDCAYGHCMDAPSYLAAGGFDGAGMMVAWREVLS